MRQLGSGSGGKPPHSLTCLLNIINATIVIIVAIIMMMTTMTMMTAMTTMTRLCQASVSISCLRLHSNLISPSHSNHSSLPISRCISLRFPILSLQHRDDDDDADDDDDDDYDDYDDDDDDNDDGGDDYEDDEDDGGGGVQNKSLHTKSQTIFLAGSLSPLIPKIT